MVCLETTLPRHIELKRGIDEIFCAGLTFSPDGSYAYVTDTGISQALFGVNMTKPATVYVSLRVFSLVWRYGRLTDIHSYRFDVQPDGTWENRKTFAHVHARLPDGKFGSSSTELQRSLLISQLAIRAVGD